MTRSTEMNINSDSTTEAQSREDFYTEEFELGESEVIAQAEGDLEPYGSYDALAQENQKMGTTIERLRNQLRREYVVSNRLRRLRNQYRLTTEELSDQVTQLLSESQEQGEIGSSDGEKKGLSSLQRIEEEPEVNGPVAASQGYNKYYPDVPEFHGDHDKWDSWRLHLQSKFRASAMLVPTEQARIDYICDHCKSIAIEIIKTRCLDGTQSTAQEVLEDLRNVYGELMQLARLSRDFTAQIST